MSGHSKWSTIKHKKAKADAARGRLFTKLIKEITVAARMGGGDPNGNPRLRKAIDAAKAVNMPSDNIDRGIKRGTGELEGITYEEVTYEGYGPGGSAVLVQVVTDNKNRTHGEIRRVFEKHNGSLGTAGCVAWIFEKRGYLTFERGRVDDDVLMEAAIEAGALDVVEREKELEVLTDPHDFDAVKEKLISAGLTPVAAEVTMVPKTSVKLSGHDAEQMLKLMEGLEEHDDVQHVYANFDIDEEVMQKLSEHA
jgi:YebC/PmpR family DNA-binding regulatory protein